MQSLVYLRAWGCLDISSLLQLRHDILTHPDFEPGFHLIADVSELETQALALTDMATIAKLQLWKPTGRRAFLVRSHEQIALAQAFAAFRDPQSVFIGRYLKDALEWIGLDSKGFRADAPERRSVPTRPSTQDVTVTKRCPDGEFVIECSTHAVEHYGSRQWSEARLAAARRVVEGAAAWFKDEINGGKYRRIDLETGMLGDD